MYCGNCGQELKQKTSFCPFCGVKLVNEPQKEIKDLKAVGSKKVMVLPTKHWQLVFIGVIAIIAVITAIFFFMNKSDYLAHIQVLYDFIEAHNTGDTKKFQKATPCIYYRDDIEEIYIGECEKFFDDHKEEGKLEISILSTDAMDSQLLAKAKQNIDIFCKDFKLNKEVEKGYIIGAEIKVNDEILLEKASFEVIKIKGEWYVSTTAMRVVYELGNIFDARNGKINVENTVEIQETETVEVTEISETETEESIVETENLNNEDDIVAAIELYADLLEDADKLSERIDAHCKIYYPSAYKMYVDMYSIEDLDADNIPELLLYGNMKSIYIIDNQMRISQIKAQDVYNVPDENYFYCDLSAGTGLENLMMAYNAELRGERLPEGGGAFITKTLLKADWNSYYNGNPTALVDGEDNVLSSDEYSTRREQYMDESKNVKSYFFSDKTALEKWKNQ